MTKNEIETVKSSEPSSCCGPTCCDGRQKPGAKQIKGTVREDYGKVAKSQLSDNDTGVHAVAKAFGYTEAALRGVPASANMGLSCGNPVATAFLKAGETVVDLGSGGGLDVFLAAGKVGPTGKAIGIDMTPEMVERARKGATDSGIANVEFHLASIDKIPLADAIVDCVISNCVINLAPDKNPVFCEIYRILKPGGRVSISDIVLKKPLPEILKDNVQAYTACIAGAITSEQFRDGLKNAGFREVLLMDSGSDLNAYKEVEGQCGCCSPACASSESSVHANLAVLTEAYDLNVFAGSVIALAIK